MINHNAQWQRIQTAWFNQRIPQAMLFVGPLHCALSEFTTNLLQLFFCKSTLNQPCLTCLDCLMAKSAEHPDIQWIKPDKSGGSIKVDQIRELQYSAYLTPQRSKKRVIIIEAADRMNSAAANSLLKILEEPAQHTLFILMAQQLSTILPTVLSRTQMMPFSVPEDLYKNNLLKLGNEYPDESERSLILKQAELLLDGLIAVIERKTHPCVLAAEWVQFDLTNLLWFLYLAYAQLQLMNLCQNISVGPGCAQLVRLNELLNPPVVFMQIDKINAIIRKMSHNLNVNHVLALEDLLLTLVAALK